MAPIAATVQAIGACRFPDEKSTKDAVLGLARDLRGNPISKYIQS